MKAKALTALKELEDRLKDLVKTINGLSTETVSKEDVRKKAEETASYWVENVRSPLEHKFKVSKEIIQKYSELFRELHVLSRPKTLKSKYQNCLKRILSKYKDELELHLLQSEGSIHGDEFLQELMAKVGDAEVSAYLKESFSCAVDGHIKAAIVMGWCATVDGIQQKILRTGFDKFNQTSSQMKAQQVGRFKRFNKEFKVNTLGELQEVFDNDLIWVVEGMGLIDSNQAERLRTCFQYRNNSAHPGYAPISKVHMHAFFSDVIDIVVSNPSFVT